MIRSFATQFSKLFSPHVCKSEILGKQRSGGSWFEASPRKKKKKNHYLKNTQQKKGLWSGSSGRLSAYQA
jgi:hypothetical protein